MPEDHIRLTSHGMLFFDEYAATVLPADLYFARCENDANGPFNLPTSSKLARFTLRWFAVETNQFPRDGPRRHQQHTISTNSPTGQADGATWNPACATRSIAASIRLIGHPPFTL